MKNVVQFLFLFLSSYSFGQAYNKLDLKKEGEKYHLNGAPYNGKMYELYSSGFLKSEFEVKNGIIDGVVKFYSDNNRNISFYQDSTLLKTYQDTLKSYSKMSFNLQKDSARYNNEKKRIFDEEIKTVERLVEWKEKYDAGKLGNKKSEIYEQYKKSSNDLAQARTTLKVLNEKNAECSMKRKKELEKPVYQNILTDIYTYKNGFKSGSHQAFDKNGKLILENYFENNLLTGESKTYDSYGKIISIETYKSDKLDGPYKKYNGDIVSESGQYIDGLKNGEWISVLSYQKIIENYKSGKLDGLYKKYNGDVVIEEGSYSNGIKTGEWKIFSTDGKLTSLSNYSNGKLNGPFKKYNGDNVIEEGNYSDGLMTGEWVFNYNSGKIKGKGKYLSGDGDNLGKTGIPKNGRDGNWLLYYENGNLSSELNYKNGNLEGIWKSYHENGNLDIVSEYKYGKGNGKYQSYYESGKIKQESQQLNDEYDGKSITYHENGNIRTSGTYIKGKIEGNYKWFREDGTIESSSEFKNGIALSQINYDRSGNEIKKEDSYGSNNSGQSSNSNYVKKVCSSGKIWDRHDVYKNNRHKINLNVKLICPYCSHKEHGTSSVYFYDDDCEEMEFECSVVGGCGKWFILKPCLIKHLDKGDEF
jgi:antitoxin component YwqK of YwqJK toxin-antitoxin module